MAQIKLLLLNFEIIWVGVDELVQLVLVQPKPFTSSHNSAVFETKLMPILRLIYDVTFFVEELASGILNCAASTPLSLASNSGRSRPPILDRRYPPSSISS